MIFKSCHHWTILGSSPSLCRVTAPAVLIPRDQDALHKQSRSNSFKFACRQVLLQDPACRRRVTLPSQMSFLYGALGELQLQGASDFTTPSSHTVAGHTLAATSSDDIPPASPALKERHTARLKLPTQETSQPQQNPRAQQFEPRNQEAPCPAICTTLLMEQVRNSGANFVGGARELKDRHTARPCTCPCELRVLAARRPCVECIWEGFQSP